MVKGLGKGIDALFPEESVHRDDRVQQIALWAKYCQSVSATQDFWWGTAIEELASSINEHGIIQPIVVRKSGRKYEIVAGERRYRAAKLAGLAEVPVIVKDFTEQQMMEVAILENLQRENFIPIKKQKHIIV